MQAAIRNSRATMTQPDSGDLSLKRRIISCWHPCSPFAALTKLSINSEAKRTFAELNSTRFCLPSLCVSMQSWRRLWKITTFLLIVCKFWAVVLWFRHSIVPKSNICSIYHWDPYHIWNCYREIPCGAFCLTITWSPIPRSYPSMVRGISESDSRLSNWPKSKDRVSQKLSTATLMNISTL